MVYIFFSEMAELVATAVSKAMEPMAESVATAVSKAMEPLPSMVTKAMEPLAESVTAIAEAVRKYGTYYSTISLVMTSLILLFVCIFSNIGFRYFRSCVNCNRWYNTSDWA
jgi:hypothetical protein